MLFASVNIQCIPLAIIFVFATVYRQALQLVTVDICESLAFHFVNMAAMNSVVGSRVAQGSTFIPRISSQDRCFFGTSAGFSPCSVRGTRSAGSIRRKSADNHFSLR